MNHLQELISHLRVAVVQIIPTDDQIIAGHVRAALEHARALEHAAFVEDKKSRRAA